MIGKLDFVGIPSQDAERSRTFYVDVLGLRPDEHGRYEVWAGDTCFGIWEPKRFGMEFAPQKNAHPALHVDDVKAAREAVRMVPLTVEALLAVQSDGTTRYEVEGQPDDYVLEYEDGGLDESELGQEATP